MKRVIHERELQLEKLLQHFQEEKRVRKQRLQKVSQPMPKERNGKALGKRGASLERTALDQKALDRLAKGALERPLSGGLCK